MNDIIPTTDHLLGAAGVRRIAVDTGISPIKKFGQNFVIDPGMVRRIVREAGVTAADHVMEVGPGLGSLTLATLKTGATMTVVEIDSPLVERPPGTVAGSTLEATSRLTVVNRDTLAVTSENAPDFSDDASFTLVANLLYSVTTPILLTLLKCFDNFGSFLAMMQKEVAGKLAAKPGSKIYSTPSMKLAWYDTAKQVGTIGCNVFWPAPNVDSALVKFTRYQADDSAALGTANSIDDGTQRELVSRLIDVAFGQHRKTLYATLKTIVPSEVFSTTGIDPTRRRETLAIAKFIALAKVIESCEDGDEAQ